MTDNEIIKALECCQYEGVKTCRDCPMFYTHEFDNEIDFDCGKYIYGRALNLINRQKAEIERLEKKANTPFAKVTFDENKLKEIVSDVAKNIEFNLNSVKSEAIKEFAERLKKRFYLSAGRCVVDVYHIDRIVKEMTEVQE